MKTPDLITDTVATLGPNGRAMLESRAAANRSVCPKGCSYGTYRAATNGRGRGDIWECGCGMRWSDTSDPWGAQLPEPQPSPRPTVLNLLRDARELIARRRDPVYGSLQITDAQVDELARAWVQNLMSNYVVAGME